MEIENNNLTKPQYCKICKKVYKCLATYKQHLRGKNTKESEGVKRGRKDEKARVY